MQRERSRQLQLEVVPSEAPARPRPARSKPKPPLGPGRLALGPNEAAAALGVSRDYFDEHILTELRRVRRGRRILIPVAEIERWLVDSTTPPCSRAKRAAT